jgi:hypothetical protein
MKLTEIITDDTETFKRLFQVFINSRQRNQWLETDTIKIYIRKGTHMIDGNLAKTLDIANINIDETERGQGVGTMLIDWLHQQNPFPVTHVENIQNPRLYTHLKRLGWLDVAGTEPPSVYKLKYIHRLTV